MSLEDERLELALKASNEGIWDWDLSSGEIYYSNRLLMFLGYGRIGAPNIFAEVEKRVHPDERVQFQRKLDRLILEGGKLFATEARILTNGGGWKWFRVRGVPERDHEGNAIRVVGSLIDISKRRNAQIALAEERSMVDLVLDSTPVNVYFKDRDSKFVRTNVATAQRMGVKSVAELIGKTDHDFFGKEHADQSRARELKIMETGVGHKEVMEHEVWEDGTESWVLVTKEIWRSMSGEVIGTFGLTHEVTELMKLQNDLKRVASELQGVNREISEERHLLRLVVDNVPVFVYFKDLESNFVLVNRRLAEFVEASSTEDVEGKHNRDFFLPSLVQSAEADEKRIMETGEPIERKLEELCWKDRKVTWSVSSKYPWYHRDGSLRGTFGVSSDVTALMQTREKLEQITEVLGQQNEAMEEELNLAREIQQAAFPSEILPMKAAGIEARFHHRYQPASKLAGDFFEVLPLSEGKAGFFVCDVMGHGVRSALVVSMLRGLIEKQYESLGAEAGAFLTGLNDGLCHLLERTAQMIFATAVYGVVDLVGGEICFSLAGHPSPMLRRGGQVEILEVGAQEKGPALGVVPGFVFSEVTLPLREVSGVLMFTDGVFEVLDKKGEEFGLERLQRALEKTEGGASALDEVMRAAQKFAVEGVFEDDLCLLGLELRAGT